MFLDQTLHFICCWSLLYKLLPVLDPLLCGSGRKTTQVVEGTMSMSFRQSFINSHKAVLWKSKNLNCWRTMSGQRTDGRTDGILSMCTEASNALRIGCFKVTCTSAPVFEKIMKRYPIFSVQINDYQIDQIQK